MQDMLPVMLAFLLATVHASLCKWLKQQLKQQNQNSALTSSGNLAQPVAGASLRPDVPGHISRPMFDASTSGTPRWGHSTMDAGSTSPGMKDSSDLEAHASSHSGWRVTDSQCAESSCDSDGAWAGHADTREPTDAAAHGVTMHSPVVYYLGKLAVAMGA